MNKFQRIKNIFFGISLISFAILLLLIPEESFSAIVSILCLSLLLYGFKLLWYYVSMARHMVGGKSFLYQSIIVLDLALFTLSVISMSSFYIMIYLMGVYAFAGAIDILRALEAKKNRSPYWKMKFSSGCIRVIATIALFIPGIILQKTDILVYGYCLNLVYAAVMRIISAFRRTAIIYIQ